jgi:S-adenosylmethionine hydrolase
MPRLITLTTDFGTRDAFVGVMKGVILRLNPDAILVDITHDIAPQNVAHAAFVLASAAPYFPPNTIHLVVVDPGVGSARRALAAQVGETFFVAPDNGVLSLVLPPSSSVIHLTNPAYWLFRAGGGASLAGRTPRRARHTD